MPKAGVRFQMHSQGFDIILGALDMPAGFRIAILCQGSQAFDGDGLSQGQPFGAFFYQVLQMILVSL